LRKGDCFPLTILNLQVLTTLLVAQAGGCSVIMDRIDAAGVAQWIRDHGVTTWNGPPALLYSLVHHPAIDPADLASLDEVWAGGADCPESLRAAFTDRFGLPVLTTYGLTEAPTVVSIDPRNGEHRRGASGRPLPHVRVMIRDDHGNELSTAETGEICLCAHEEGPWAGVYQPPLGYWQRRDASEDLLRGGVVHTGDVGYVDAEGFLYVRDRRNQMIIRGGANVYPAEVERVLQAVPGVEGCAVFGTPDERLGERVTAAVQRGRPIRLVYPLVCKIGCWAKQMTNIGPNAAERACLQFFNHVNRVVKEFYAPGVVIELVCDAHLYNSAIQLPYHEVNAYVRRFAKLVRDVAPETVGLHDYCDLLEQFDPGSRRYRAAYQRYHRLLRDQPDQSLGGADHHGLFESVRALVNTRRLGLPYEDHRALFGPAPDRSNPHWAEVEAMTESAVREMVATRMACSDLDVLGAAFPDMVRVSCHRGRKAGRAVIGLRVYPEYYRSSLFLPYHGIAVLWGDGPCPGLELHPEVVLRGDPNLVRVLQPDGDVFCYRAPAGWRAPAIPRGMNGVSSGRCTSGGDNSLAAA